MKSGDFSIIIDKLECAYPNSKAVFDAKTKALWALALGDLDYRLCDAAVTMLIATNKFMPSIAEIREKCLSLVNAESENWQTAWQNVLRACSRFGSDRISDAYNSFNEITKQTVKTIGYRLICQADNSQLPYIKRDFKETYLELSNKLTTKAQMSSTLKIDTKKTTAIEDKQEVKKQEYKREYGISENNHKKLQDLISELKRGVTVQWYITEKLNITALSAKIHSLFYLTQKTDMSITKNVIAMISKLQDEEKKIEQARKPKLHAKTTWNNTDDKLQG